MTLEQCFIKDSEAVYQAAQDQGAELDAERRGKRPILSGITTPQIGNISVNATIFDRHVMRRAAYGLHEIPGLKNPPQVLGNYSSLLGEYAILRCGDWDINCYDTGIKVSEYLYRTIDIPEIPYARIVSVSFDLYLDKTRLVGIWFELDDGQVMDVLTHTRRPQDA